MRRVLRAGVAAAVLALLVAAVASAGADKASQSSTTMVFGAAADPIVLDAALISDGESFRVVYQITETLVGLQPGTTKLAPMLATKWVKSNGGRRWTFTLRRNVEFHDGTPFNAAAVCANFNRWYNFKGAQQSSSASYYYNYVFGGFKTKGAKDALYRSCSARGSNVAVINLKRPYGPVPRSDDPVAVRDPEPDVDARERGRQGPPHRPTASTSRSATYGVPGGEAVGHRPVQARVVACRRPARARAGTTSTGAARPSLSSPDLPGDPRQHGTPAGAPDRRDRRVRPRRAAGHQHDHAEPRSEGPRPPAFNVGYVGINRSVEPFDNIARPARSGARPRPRSGREVVLRGPRSGGARVHAADASPGYSTSVPKYAYNPNRAKAAAPAGRPHVAGRGRVLVADRRVPSVHAEPEEQLPGVRREPQASRDSR